METNQKQELSPKRILIYLNGRYRQKLNDLIEYNGIRQSDLFRRLIDSGWDEMNAKRFGRYRGSEMGAIHQTRATDRAQRKENFDAISNLPDAELHDWLVEKGILHEGKVDVADERDERYHVFEIRRDGANRPTVWVTLYYVRRVTGAKENYQTPEQWFTYDELLAEVKKKKLV